LTTRISPRAYEDWVTRTAFDGSEGGLLRVTVPDQVTKTWMEQEYAEDIRETIRELNLPVEHVVYTTQPGVTSSPLGQSQEPMFANPSQLNRKFRFDNYVVGSCNQFAHAAARAVAKSPSRSYNPLFIYGGSGMGKTHLMHSIGTELAEQYSAMRIVYTSSERFMNEMINCIKTDRMPAFHRFYRSADVLLIDDIHILAGKERTQEEFFHTFNELYEHQKQIVVSSDSTPKSTPGLVDRLRSRFEWGLMVDIQPPDVETKMAILDKKAEMEGVTLPEDVRVYIATKTKSNVRELEGALVKLVAFSSVMGTPITLAMAQQVLKYLARYTHRVAISNSRLVALDDAGVTFDYKDYADDRRHKHMTLPAFEFLRRFLQHVLPSGFVKIRHYGLLANRYRAANLHVCRTLLLVATVAALMGVHAAAVCPQCGAGVWQVIARTPRPRVSEVCRLPLPLAAAVDSG